MFCIEQCAFMGNPAGVRRNFQKLEKRRLWAARLLRKGLRPAEVAQRVGVQRQSVNRWARQLKQGGLRSLEHTGRAGRKPSLSAEDLRRVERGLKRGSWYLGYETYGWTSKRVADLIKQECGVQYNPSQAWRILRNLGWTCYRSSDRNEWWWNKPRRRETKKRPGNKA